MTMILLRNKLLVRPVSESDQTDSGLLLGSMEKSSYKKGEIVVRGIESDPSVFSVGQTITFEKNTANKFNYNGEELLLINDFDVICID